MYDSENRKMDSHYYVSDYFYSRHNHDNLYSLRDGA